MKRSWKGALVATLCAVFMAAPAMAAISPEVFELCWKGSTEEIRAGIKSKKIRLKDRDADGNTPLMLVAKWNAFVDSMNVVIKAGGNVNDRNKENMTPLILAAENNPNEEIVVALLKAGAKVNSVDKDGATALMHAARSGTTEEVFMTLLNNGADLFAKDKQGRTVLDYAKAGKFDVMIRRVEHEIAARKK